MFTTMLQNLSFYLYFYNSRICPLRTMMVYTNFFANVLSRYFIEGVKTDFVVKIKLIWSSESMRFIFLNIRRKCINNPSSSSYQDIALSIMNVSHLVEREEMSGITKVSRIHPLGVMNV